MARHLVLGAGGIGRSVARALAERGHDVTIASRSGRDPHLDGVRALALDARDRDAVTGAARGAVTIVNAMNPAHYHRWQRDWPSLADAALAAAEASGARLLTVGNLYPYGRVSAPMREDTPEAPNGAKGRVRARMWADVLAAHRRGRVVGAELRASDYIGSETLASSVLAQVVLPALLRGRTARPPVGVADAPHSWTADRDVARLAVAVVESGDDAWGRLWHVPSDEPKSFTDVARIVADLTGRPVARVRPLPRVVGTVGGAVVPLLHALQETRHQFEAPFVLDDRAARDRFGLEPQPLVETLRETVAALERRGTSGR